jgi:LEA14-like dessication related protein
MKGLLSFFAVLALCAGCSRPKPPTVTPESVQVTSLTPTVLDLLAKLDVHNPNGFPLIVHGVSGKLVLDGNVDMGTAQTTSGVSVPANANQRVSVTLSVPWRNLAALAPLVLEGKPVSYRFDGKATVGGNSLNVDVPFTLTGSLTSAELLQAGLKNLPKLPGIPH